MNALEHLSGPETTVGTKVLTGIDVHKRDNFKQLDGLKIGLVTNHTGRDREGRQTIDALRKAPNVKLLALFSPEHGIRGLADEKVSDSKDDATGLPIYSLYGETRRPRAEQLNGLDALVFTGGIGENASTIRARVCRDAAWLDVQLDEAANNAHGPRISREPSRVSVWVIPTNEELMIARHTLRLISSQP